jgi:hypothetical protein
MHLLAALVQIEKPWEYFQEIVLSPECFYLNHQKWVYPSMEQQEAFPWQELDSSAQQ